MTKRLKKRLGTPEAVDLFLDPPIVNSRVGAQDIDAVDKDLFTVSTDIYKKLLRNGTPTSVDVRHLMTGATYSIAFDGIEEDAALSSGMVRMNFYQRQILNIPKKIADDAENMHMIDKYKRANCFGIVNKDGELEKSAPDPASQHEWQMVQFFPRYADEEISISWFERLCNFTIGDATANLKASRPYKIDDARDIVRISSDNMALLGLENTDNVILSYRGKRYRAMVMGIDDVEKMRQTNIRVNDGDLELMVGIPAPIRNKLGITDIDTTLKVDRDCRYLMKKNSNLQLVPLAALFLTVLQLGELEWWIRLLICVVASPIVMFITLSEERNKIGKKRKHRRGEC